MLAMPVASVVPDAPAGRTSASTQSAPGPWKLVEWKHDDYLLFAKNPAYFARRARRSTTLRARIIAEPSTARRGVRERQRRRPADSGDAGVRLDTRTKAASRCSCRRPALELVYIGINTTRGPLADARVRQAINYAVDIDRIIERLVSGRGTRAAGVIPPALGGYDSTRKPYPYDPAKAKQLLAAAGHPNGIDIELWSSNVAALSHASRRRSRRTSTPSGFA